MAQNINIKKIKTGKLKSKLCSAALMLVLTKNSFAADDPSVIENKELLSSSQTVLPDVKVWVNRSLRSEDGNYLLSLWSGVWNPHATLYHLAQQESLSFEGYQKGNHIRLSSFDPEIGEQAKGAFSLEGVLDVDQASYQATLTSQNQTSQKNILFQPLVRVANRPTFLFKFYHLGSMQPYSQTIEKIEVRDKKTNSIYQILSGFVAYSYSVTYMDLNYDGYFDLILTDLSKGKKVGDDQYIFWMYNPKTQKFQRSPQLERIGGFPTLYIENNQVNLGKGHIYDVKNGQFYPVQLN